MDASATHLISQLLSLDLKSENTPFLTYILKEKLACLKSVCNEFKSVLVGLTYDNRQCLSTMQHYIISWTSFYE